MHGFCRLYVFQSSFTHQVGHLLEATVTASHTSTKHTCARILRINRVGKPDQSTCSLRHFCLMNTLKHVQMHQHIAHPPGPEPAPGVLDNISDTLLNAFAKLRKPDERFLQMREGVDKSEEGLQNSERIWTRARARTNGESCALTPLWDCGSCEFLRLKRWKL